VVLIYTPVSISCRKPSIKPTRASTHQRQTLAGAGYLEKTRFRNANKKPERVRHGTRSAQQGGDESGSDGAGPLLDQQPPLDGWWRAIPLALLFLGLLLA